MTICNYCLKIAHLNKFKIMNKILITAELLNEIVLKLSNVPAGQVYETLKKIEKEASESESNLNKYVTDEINKELLSQ